MALRTPAPKGPRAGGNPPPGVVYRPPIGCALSVILAYGIVYPVALNIQLLTIPRSPGGSVPGLILHVLGWYLLVAHQLEGIPFQGPFLVSLQSSATVRLTPTHIFFL